MSHTRSERRAHRARLLVRRLKEERMRCWGNPQEDPYLQLRARKRLVTPRPCSCRLCASPRRLYGNGRASLTLQELRLHQRRDD